MDRYKELEKQINKIETIIDSENYKEKSYSEKKDLLHKYIELATEQNNIKRYPSKKRMKLKLINKVLKDMDKLDELKIRSIVAYERAKSSIKKNIMRKLNVK